MPAYKASSHVTITCLQCGKKFPALRYQNKRFCSRRCSNVYHSVPTKIGICLECGKEFSLRIQEKKTYCSKACYLKNIKRKPRTCPQCGKVYIPKRQRQKHCSPYCQSQARRSRVSIRCETCGKEFETISCKKERTRYCCKKCQMLDMFSSKEEQHVIKLVTKLLDESPIVQHTFSWLKNPDTGRSLYIDAYFPGHNLIVEYDGKQHLHFMPFYHKTRQQFLALQQRDRTKESLIKEHGLLLIRISDKEPRTQEHVAKRLIEANVELVYPKQLQFFDTLCGSHS